MCPCPCPHGYVLWHLQEEVVFGALLGHETVSLSDLNLEGLVRPSRQENVCPGPFSSKGVIDSPEGLVQPGGPPLEGGGLFFVLLTVHCFV